MYHLPSQWIDFYRGRNTPSNPFSKARAFCSHSESSGAAQMWPRKQSRRKWNRARQNARCF